MPGKAQVRELSTFVVRSSMQMLVDEVIRKPKDDGPTIASDPELDALPELPEVGSYRLGSMLAPPLQVVQVMPDDLYAGLVGLEDQKQMLEVCLKSSNRGPNRLHAILYGPSGTGKSALTDDTTRIPGAIGDTGANLTGPGLAAQLLDAHPPIVYVIEEIDNLNPSAYGTLLRAMDGYVTRTVHEGRQDAEVTTIFVATTNRLHAVPTPLRRRFVEIEVPTLTKAQLEAVIASHLEREGIEDKEAHKIANRVAAKSGDIRDALQVVGAYKQSPEAAWKMVDNLKAPSPTATPIPRRRRR
jgi:hypothetical protein